MNGLSTDVVLAVLQWLEARDLESSQRVCRSWRRLLQCDDAKDAKVRALWRAVYLRTWPPPLAPTAAAPTTAAARGQAGHEYEAEDKLARANWSHECRQRLRLERDNDPQCQVMQLANVMRRGAAAALRDPLLYEAEADDDNAEEDEEEEEVEEEPAKPELMEEEKEDEMAEEKEEEETVEEGAGNLVPNVHSVAAGRVKGSKQLKKVQDEISSAKRLLCARSNVAFMRDRTQTLLSSINMRRARGQEVHRLLSLLAKNVLHSSFDSFNGTHLATGLPLHVSWSFEFHREERTHTTVQAYSACGSVSLHQESYALEEEQQQHDDEQVAALLTFLFGAAHALVVRPAEMEVFLRAVLTPRESSGELELGW